MTTTKSEPCPTCAAYGITNDVGCALCEGTNKVPPPNKSDRASAELAAVVAKYAPDYTAPSLTNLLVKVAREIGLSRETVVDNIDRLWEMHDAPGGKQ